MFRGKNPRVEKPNQASGEVKHAVSLMKIPGLWEEGPFLLSPLHIRALFEVALLKYDLDSMEFSHLKHSGQCFYYSYRIG